MFIEIACNIAVVVLLTMAIWKNGTLFRQRYGMYMTAIVISIIINLLSVSTILLIITMFISDWVWVKPDKDDCKVDYPLSKFNNSKMYLTHITEYDVKSLIMTRCFTITS